MNFKEFIKGGQKQKIVIVGILAVIFLVLFFFYRRTVIGNGPVVKDFSTTTVKTLSTDELKKIIPERIDSIAYLFGIKKDWIRESGAVPEQDKQKSKKDKIKKPVVTVKDNLWFSKEITIPRDVPAAEVNFEIGNLLYEYDFDRTGIEDPKNGNVLINIYNKKDSSKKTIAEVQFVYTDKIKREASDICLVINNVDNMPLGQLEKILKSPEKFSVVLPDLVDKIDAQTVVLDSKRDYLLFMDIGTEQDMAAEFRTDMKEKEWRSKVRTVCYEYDKAAGVIILNPKKIAPLGTDLLMEFGLYNLKAYKDTVLIKFTSEEKDKRKIDALFSDIVSRTQKGGRSMIYLVNFSADEFNYYKDEIFRLKRRGYKFFTFSEILKRRQKNPETEIKQEITG